MSYTIEETGDRGFDGDGSYRATVSVDGIGEVNGYGVTRRRARDSLIENLVMVLAVARERNQRDEERIERLQSDLRVANDSLDGIGDALRDAREIIRQQDERAKALRRSRTTPWQRVVQRLTD